MPKPKTRTVSESYIRIDEASRKFGETRDCSVKALAILTGASYAAAHAALKAAGRTDRQGAWSSDMKRAAATLGFSFERVNLQPIIQQYPERHQTLKSVTSYHPARFRRAWKDQPDMLMETSGHFLAFKGGKVHDWSASRALRVTWAYKLVRL